MNLGKFEELHVSFDDNVTYLVGDNGEGKSTIGIEAIQILFQGISQKKPDGQYPLIGERFRFIGPNAKSLNIIGVLYDDVLKAEITIHREVTAKEQTIKFEAPEGVIIDQDWLNAVFNIFMVSPKHFESLSPKEQAIALGIDLTAHDEAIEKIKAENTTINRQIKEMGAVDMSILKQPVKEVINIVNLQKVIAETKQFNQDEASKDFALETARTAYENQKAKLAQMKKEYEELLLATKTLGAEIPTMPVSKFKPVVELEEQYNNAAQNNIDVITDETLRQKANKLTELKKCLEGNAKKIEKEELTRIATIKKKQLPYKELSIDDKGQLLLEDRFIKEPFFSTGQLIKIIPTLMTAANPDLRYVFIQGFDLLDEANKKSTIEYLMSRGLQVVIESIGHVKNPKGNQIILKNCKIESDE